MKVLKFRKKNNMYKRIVLILLIFLVSGGVSYVLLLRFISIILSVLGIFFNNLSNGIIFDKAYVVLIMLLLIKGIVVNIRKKNEKKMNIEVVENRKKLLVLEYDKEKRKEYCFENEMTEVNKYSYCYNDNEGNKPYLSVVSSNKLEKGISRKRLMNNNKNH